MMERTHRHEDRGMTSSFRRLSPAIALALLAALAAAPAGRPALAGEASVPPEKRGTVSAERMGTHDANNIRTRFWNFGMVGDYPSDPGGVDLSVFHSAEVPKGTGMNYTDGTTPFVLERFHPGSDTTSWSYVMETGFRERQAFDPYNRMMRFEPRPGFFQPDPNINRGRSPAMSHDPRTWPDSWPDREADPDDPGWAGSWDGYFGKRPAADQESFFVMDDQLYSLLPFNPDATDLSRRGLALKVEVRGFQWSNPQAGNVIFWHYDIVNEGTVDYPDIVFGMYMDSGVGGSSLSCDNVYESDDDNAYFDRSLGLNLVYTWDSHGHGVDLNGTCSRTGYLGYAYLETPGKPRDGVDNDSDGITDEQRDGGPGTLVLGEEAIRAWVESHYDTTKFYGTYGPLEKRPAYKSARWWTGDEDLDWNVYTDDLGHDGVPGTHDTGEGDGMPTDGEPNFDKTDLNESDQIGLTGFRMNRISRGVGNTDPHPADGITFANLDNKDWPALLYEQFTDPSASARFDSAVAQNWNIGFLFASGPFELKAGQHERFSLALAYGSTLPELRSAVHTVQQIYNANYQFAVPPKRPTLTAETGDGQVRLSWDDVAERSIDPVTFEQDFEGYRIYRSTDPDFLDPKKVYNGQGTQPVGNGQPIVQFDLPDNRLGYSRLAVDGVQYWLGTDNGIRHTWTDTTATNGQQYYYAVCAYDYGFDTGVDSTSFYPSENSIPVSRTPRGGLILPSNVVAVRAEPKVAGWQEATASAAAHGAGKGTGTVGVEVVNSNLVPDAHLMALGFYAHPDSVRAQSYWLRDSTTHEMLFETGRDLQGQGTGPVGGGLLPIVTTSPQVYLDTANSGWAPGSTTNAPIVVNGGGFAPALDQNLRRPGYPYDISIVFDDVVRDTAVRVSGADTTNPAKFRVFAHTPQGDQQLDFRFRDIKPPGGAKDGTLTSTSEVIDIVTYASGDPTPKPTWRVQLASIPPGGLVPPHLGDVYELKVQVPLTVDDIFTFSTGGQRIDGADAKGDWNEKPYVVPNPYVAAASFEPQRYASSGRGDRRVEFRAIPQGATIRIYTLHGDLVRTLTQDGSVNGYVPWDLRTRDNLDVAPGLYVFHVDAPGLGTHVGKFAILK
jgi:hypothetical protein